MPCLCADRMYSVSDMHAVLLHRYAEPRLAAARSRSGSDDHSGRHSLPSRRCATRKGAWCRLRPVSLPQGGRGTTKWWKEPAVVRVRTRFRLRTGIDNPSASHSLGTSLYTKEAFRRLRTGNGPSKAPVPTNEPKFIPPTGGIPCLICTPGSYRLVPRHLPPGGRLSVCGRGHLIRNFACKIRPSLPLEKANRLRTRKQIEAYAPATQREQIPKWGR